MLTPLLVPLLLCAAAPAAAETELVARAPAQPSQPRPEEVAADEPAPDRAQPAATPPARQSPAPADLDAVPGAGVQRLEEARRAYDALRLDDARIALDRALRDASNQRAQLVEIYRLKGVVEASMGQPIAAKRAFSQVLVLQPDLELPDDLSPKITSAFDAARASLPGERGIALESAAPAEVLMGKPAELPLRLNDTLGMVEQIVVRYRVAGQEPVEVLLTRADQGLLRVPAASLPTRDAPYEVELEAIAQSAYGAELARLAPDDSAARVRVVAEFAEEPVPIYQRWWLWAGVAGGVALAAAAAGVTAWALVPPDTSPRDVAVVVE